MLPFLKPKTVAGMIITKRKPDESKEEPMGPESDDSGDAELEACAADIISAIEMKDAKALASAIKSAFTCLESQPHEEADEAIDLDLE